LANSKAIATLGPERAPVLPDLITAREGGLGELDCGAWGAWVFPKGVPAPIVRRLAHAASLTIDTPAVRERLQNLGVTVIPPERRSPEYLAEYIPSEIEKWAAVTRRAAPARIDQCARAIVRSDLGTRRSMWSPPSSRGPERCSRR
jgi:tripartite-type tricarboxylate transporter receptor subunit TctC